MAHVEDSTNLPVISDLAQFDRNSGSWLERLVFNHRAIVVLLCALSTLYLGYYTVVHLRLQSEFEKMLPKNHPYVLNYKENAEQLRALGNVVFFFFDTW